VRVHGRLGKCDSSLESQGDLEEETAVVRRAGLNARREQFIEDTRAASAIPDPFAEAVRLRMGEEGLDLAAPDDDRRRGHTRLRFVLDLSEKAPAEAPLAPTESSRLVAGALYDFVGYLSSRPGSVEIGADFDAQKMHGILGAWARRNGLTARDAYVTDWSDRLADGS